MQKIKIKNIEWDLSSFDKNEFYLPVNLELTLNEIGFNSFPNEIEDLFKGTRKYLYNKYGYEAFNFIVQF